MQFNRGFTGVPSGRLRHAPRRFLTAGLAGLLAGASALAVTTGPAAAGVTQYVLPTSVSYTDARQPTLAFPTTAADVPVGTWQADGVKHTSRAYFTFDLTPYRGKEVITAQVVTGESAVTDCDRPRKLELWRTDTPAAAPTWNTAPAVREKVGDVGPTAPCPASYLEMGATEVFRQAVADGRDSLTLMARIAGDHEENKHFGRRVKKPGASLLANGAPDVPSKLIVAGRACTDGLLIGTTTPILTAEVTDPDKLEPYAGDQVRATFAWWPVDRPAERTEWTSSGWYAPALIQYTVPSGLLVDGGTYAFVVRAADEHAASGWSPECRFTVDTVRPPAPTVVSTDYPADSGFPGHGGPGIAGDFTFSSAADDIAGFWYGRSGLTTYAAAGPGGTATVSYTPDRYGPSWLNVQAVDRTGNRSTQTRYEFTVRNTAPTVTDGDPDAWLGQPREFTFAPNMTDVVEYVWSLNNGTQQTVAADAAGTATVTVTPTLVHNTVHVRSRTRDGVLSGDAGYTFSVRTAPFVTSEQWTFDGMPGAPAGTEGSFTFKPAMADVTEYVYAFDYGDPRTVQADADGSATISYTPANAGHHTIEVFSRTSAGVQSASVGLAFYPASIAPTVASEVYPRNTTGGGPGVPGTFTFAPHSSVTGVTSYVYQFRGEPERTVAANADGTASVEWTPSAYDNEYGGWTELRVRARTAAGVTTDAQYYSFRVDPQSPLVTSDVFGWQGGAVVGQTGEFVFTAQLPGTTEFVYSFDDGAESTVAAGADGTARVSWAADSPYGHSLTVRSRTAAGVVSGPAYYNIFIDPS
ncbi:hypothetical protein [Micromonospora sp. CA-111912]|uniref:hypothetical protein n=1 Tax=Micromonospora sp. CA-111912 TaxID=3239955 RepID=UPI003D944160